MRKAAKTSGNVKNLCVFAPSQENNNKNENQNFTDHFNHNPVF